MKPGVAIAAVTAFAAAPAESLSALEITSFAVDSSANTATVSFTAGEAGVTNALYYVWSNDGFDKGAAIADWPNVVRIGRVGEADAGATFSLPDAAAVSAPYAARVFLARSSVQYDYFVEKVKTGSTSGGYVNTGVKPNKTTAVVIDAEWRATTAAGRKNTTLFGCAHSSEYESLFAFSVYINGDASKFASACCDHKGDWQASGIAPDTNRHVFHLDAATGKLDIYTDGVLVDTTQHNTDAITMESSLWPMMLFARGHGQYNNQADQYSSSAIYSCVISNNNALVRSYVPCVYGGIPGMYDSVNNKFYSSVNGTELIADGTNTTYFVAAGDTAFASSMVWRLHKSGLVLIIK